MISFSLIVTHWDRIKKKILKFLCIELKFLRAKSEIIFNHVSLVNYIRYILVYFVQDCYLDHRDFRNISYF